MGYENAARLATTRRRFQESRNVACPICTVSNVVERLEACKDIGRSGNTGGLLRLIKLEKQHQRMI